MTAASCAAPGQIPNSIQPSSAINTPICCNIIGAALTAALMQSFRTLDGRKPHIFSMSVVTMDRIVGLLNIVVFNRVATYVHILQSIAPLSGVVAAVAMAVAVAAVAVAVA